ncbi:MAG: CIA30 family protein [Prochlorothrix sp.]
MPPSPPPPPPIWNPIRLVQTLAYYQVVPFLGSLDWLFPPPPIPAPELGPNAMDSTTTSLASSSTSMAGDPAAAADSVRVIFDFRRSSPALQQIWGTVDDVVMGGVSESRIQWQDQRGIFGGYVSTGNGGGFASVRTRNLTPPLDLSGYDGIELRVRGDGQRYKFLLRSSSGWDSLAYAAGFDTEAVLARDSNGNILTPDPSTQAEAWQTVRLPFAALRPVFRARTVADAPPFDSAQVTSLQLMLSKFEYDGALNPRFQAGPFRLEVESIAVYRGERGSIAPSFAVQ